MKLKLTPQIFFDQTVEKIRKQGRASLRAAGIKVGISGPSGRTEIDLGTAAVCAFRGVGDCRCVVGWWLPDESYHPDLEHADPDDVFFRIVLPLYDAAEHGPQMLDLCKELIRAHDSSALHPDGTRYSSDDFMEKFLAECRGIARRFRLSADMIDREMLVTA